MAKNHTSVIWVIITALMLIALVYVYYERQIDAMEEKAMKNPP
jgi:hypothetical protein